LVIATESFRTALRPSNCEHHSAYKRQLTIADVENAQVGGGENMRKKIRSRLLAAIEVLGDRPLAASQEERKYVLEDVFWVPASNSSSRRATSRRISEHGAGRTNASEASR